MGVILTAQSLGLFAGGLILLRLRPRRLLLTATLGFLLTIPFLLALAGPLPLPAVIGLAAMAGLGIEIFGIMWDTTMQQEIPQEKLSRVYSYDALGSFVLIPLGYAVAGPVSEAIGTRATILGAAAISLTATLLVLLVRDVRTIERRPLVGSSSAAAENHGSYEERENGRPDECSGSRARSRLELPERPRRWSSRTQELVVELLGDPREDGELLCVGRGQRVPGVDARLVALLAGERLLGLAEIPVHRPLIGVGRAEPLALGLRSSSSRSSSAG